MSNRKRLRMSSDEIVERQHKRRAGSSEEIIRIQTDIAGSFFMSLIGDHMEIFVCIVNDLLQRCELSFAEWARDNKSKKFPNRNILVPRGTRDDEVHWVFHDHTQKVHNPYEYRMQLEGSHQFCQSHALKLAYDYCKGAKLERTNPTDAYLKLLDFWQLLVNHLTHNNDSRCVTALNVIVEETLELVFEINRDAEQDKELIKAVISSFPRSLQGILDLMRTDYAIEHCPHWR
uniref:Uncharacterized protein n=1 Tax=viral metagenome TaxID=1070528 RepID=A0A6C0BJV6_9ZZZZ